MRKLQSIKHYPAFMVSIIFVLTGVIVGALAWYKFLLPIGNDHARKIVVTPSTIAYLKYENSFPRGNIYFKDLSTGREQQITSTLDIREIVSFSSDNKYLLVNTETVDSDRAYNNTRIISVSDLNASSVPPMDSFKNPTDSTSSDRTWKAWRDTGEGGAAKLIVQSIKNPSLNMEIADSRSGQDMLIWVHNQLIFEKNDGIYRLSPEDDFKSEKLVAMDLTEYRIGGLRNRVAAVFNSSRSVMYYELKKFSNATSKRVSDDLYRYDFIKKSTEKIADLMDYRTVNLIQQQVDLTDFYLTDISSDESLLVFNQGGQSVIYNRITNEFTQLCEGVQCNNPIFSN